MWILVRAIAHETSQMMLGLPADAAIGYFSQTVFQVHVQVMTFFLGGGVSTRQSYFQMPFLCLLNSFEMF